MHASHANPAAAQGRMTAGQEGFRGEPSCISKLMMCVQPFMAADCSRSEHCEGNILHWEGRGAHRSRQECRLPIEAPACTNRMLLGCSPIAVDARNCLKGICRAGRRGVRCAATSLRTPACGHYSLSSQWPHARHRPCNGFPRDCYESKRMPVQRAFPEPHAALRQAESCQQALHAHAKTFPKPQASAQMSQVMPGWP